MLGYTVIPLGDRLLVQSVVQDQTTSGGIVLPEVSLEVYNYGRVLCVGSKVEQEIEEGDFVIFIPYGGTVLQGDSGQLILNEADIIAKLIKEQ